MIIIIVIVIMKMCFYTAISLLFLSVSSLCLSRFLYYHFCLLFFFFLAIIIIIIITIVVCLNVMITPRWQQHNIEILNDILEWFFTTEQPTNDDLSPLCDPWFQKKKMGPWKNYRTQMIFSDQLTSNLQDEMYFFSDLLASRLFLTAVGFPGVYNQNLTRHRPSRTTQVVEGQ